MCNGNVLHIKLAAFIHGLKRNIAGKCAVFLWRYVGVIEHTASSKA